MTNRNIAVQFTPASGKLVLRQVRICFEPSAYDGSDTAKRSIVFEVPEENKKIIEEWGQPSTRRS